MQRGDSTWWVTVSVGGDGDPSGRVMPSIVRAVVRSGSTHGAKPRGYRPLLDSESVREGQRSFKVATHLTVLPPCTPLALRVFLFFLWAALTIWFLTSPSSSPVEGNVRERIKVSKEQISTSPIRESITDPPTVRIGGVDQKCSDCHALFASLDVTPSHIRQHTDLVMNHGMNGRCFNCHFKDDRNLLALNDGSTVGFADSTDLCARCHGTVFRDWELGMHGKTMGSWDASSGKQWRYRCVDCHNPHSPRFPKIEALPGPNTLRMGEPYHHDSAAQDRNPLERWKQIKTDAAQEANH
ncbi:MAG: hypothetical protein ACI80K_003343 [Paracoccaceae bacterium]|jgi:hypothetical protein